MPKEFFAHGINRLLDVVQPGMLCVFDFDGTISPIVEDPSRARIPSPVLRRLAALAEFAPVAVFTGRSVEDVSLHLDFFPDYIIGSHGFEGLPGHEQREEHYRLNCRAWMRKLQNTLIEEHRVPAIWIEDKVYSLCIHFEPVEDKDATLSRLLGIVRRTIPEAKVILERGALNVLPADAPDKGAALAELVSATDAPAAIYVGNAVTDEAVLRIPRDHLLAVSVDNSQQTAAEFHLQDISDMAAFLDILLKRLTEVTKPIATAHFSERRQ